MTNRVHTIMASLPSLQAELQAVLDRRIRLGKTREKHTLLLRSELRAQAERLAPIMLELPTKNVRRLMVLADQEQKSSWQSRTDTTTTNPPHPPPQRGFRRQHGPPPIHQLRAAARSHASLPRRGDQHPAYSGIRPKKVGVTAISQGPERSLWGPAGETPVIAGPPEIGRVSEHLGFADPYTVSVMSPCGSGNDQAYVHPQRSGAGQVGQR